MEKSMIGKNMSMFLRGIGVFLVVIAHYAQWYLTMADNNVIWILSKAGRYGVAIFFMVSGYGLVFSAKRGLDAHWISRRACKVYLPYLCIQGIICLMEKRPWTLNNIGRYVFALDVWFVLVIIILYALFYVVWKYCRQPMLWMAIGVSLVSVGLALMGKDSVWYSSNYAFLIGIAAGRYDEKVGAWILERKKLCCGIFLVGFLCSGVIYTYFTGKVEVIYILGKIIASVFWTLFVLSVFAYEERINRLVMKVGMASLEIYLIHNFVLQGVSIRVEKIGMVMVLAAALLISLILGQVLHKFFDYFHTL